MTLDENQHLITEWNAARSNAEKVINISNLTKEDFLAYCKGIISTIQLNYFMYKLYTNRTAGYDTFYS